MIENLDTNFKYKKLTIQLGILLAILESIRMAGFITYEPSYLIIFGVMLIPVLLSISSPDTKISAPYVLFFAYICLNIIVSQPHTIFHSWQRFSIFVILLCSVGPVLANKLMFVFRFKCFYTFIWIMAWMSAISCVCYFLGINYFHSVYGETDFTVQGGLFGGLFAHSMLLGPMSGISTCFLLFNYLKTKKRLFIVLAVLSMGAMFFAASRASFIATVLSCVLLVIFFYNSKTKAAKFLSIVIVSLMVTAPLWNSALIGMEQKNAGNQIEGRYGSRTVKFEARLAEFNSSPIFGIGFAAINPYGIDEFNTRTGAIEPGTSWLSTLSMTGVIGCVFVIYLLLTAFRNAKKSKNIYSSLFASLIAWFAVHMIFEGYVFAAGGTLCFVLWLIVGVATDSKYYNKAFNQ